MLEQSASRLMEQLERDCRSVPPDLREAALAEIAAHLDASIRARIELGMSLAEAETEAIRELGDTRQIAKALRQVHAPSAWHRGHLAAFAGFLASFALILGLDWGEWITDTAVTGLLLWLMLVVGLPMVLWGGWRAQRLQWRTWLLLYPLTSVWFAIAGAQAYAPDNPELDAIGTSYAEAPRLAGQLLESARLEEAKQEKRMAIYARYLAGENICPDREKWDHLGTRIAASREEAEHAWRLRRPDMPNHSVPFLRAEAARLQSLNRAFWWVGIPHYLLTTQIIAGPWVLIAALISGLGAFLRAVFEAARRKIRQRRA